jgi:hypothetical protein
MDMISAAMGLEYGSDEEMRALSQRLRKEKRAADIFAMSPTFAKEAQQQQESIMASAEKAGLHRAKQLNRQSQEKMAAERNQMYRDLSAASENFDPTQPGMTKKERTMYDPETRQFYNVGSRQGVMVNLATQEVIPKELAMRLIERRPLSQGQEDKLIQSYTDRIAPLMETARSIHTIEELLKPYAEKGVPVSEIPAMGTAERIPVLGKALRLAGDVWATGDTKAEQAPYGTMWSAVQKMINAIKHERIGSQQTKIEIKNITDELGRGALDHPDVFIAAFDRIKDILVRNAQMQIAEVDPRIMQQMEMRYADIGAQNPLTDPELWQFEKLEFPESKNIISKLWGDKLHPDDVSNTQHMIPKQKYPPHWSEEDIRLFEEANQ